MTYILGISAFYHDSAAALIRDGEIVAAAQEERFTRKKHDPQFPNNSIDFVLNEAGVTLDHVEYITFYDKPFLKFERLLETYIATAPKGFKSFKISMPIWLKEKLFLKDYLLKELKKRDKKLKNDRILFSEHHFSHAASAFYPSPFEKAIVLTLDGVGEWVTTTVSIGDGNNLDIVKEINFPHSLGLLYSAFTYYLGFKVNSGEYKVMGLAPYGVPRYTKIILDNLIDLKKDGSFKLNQKYFDYATGLTMTNSRFSELFGGPVRKPETDPLTQFHMDISASIQAVTEEVVLRITRALYDEYKIPNLCMAGGVALNCVANHKILDDETFKNIWIQPAAGDAGGALGSALAAWHMELKNPRKVTKCDIMRGSYLGPHYDEDKIISQLKSAGAVFDILNEDALIKKTAEALTNEKVVGWFQGRMEFGPRSLGNRSILADPRSDSMQKTLNLKVKFRESFRPFAPSVLSEEAGEWFELDRDSPYMLFVANVNQNIRREMNESEQSLFGIDKLNVRRSNIPAVTHVDYTARVQTVHKETNPKFHALISKFYELTECPVLINTSFNVRGEPIVCTPLDAFKCFMGTNMDVLAIGNCFLEKEKQSQSLEENYMHKYELD